MDMHRRRLRKIGIRLGPGSIGVVGEVVRSGCRTEGDPAYQVIHPVVFVLARLSHALYYIITSPTISHRPYHKGLTLTAHNRITMGNIPARNVRVL